MKKFIISILVSCLVFLSGVVLAEVEVEEVKTNYYAEGVELYRIGKYEAAVVLFDKAITESDKFSKPHYFKALCLDKLNKIEAAIAEYKVALEMAPEDIGVLKNLAWASYRNNDITDSEKYSLKAAEISPGDARAYRILGLAYFDLGKTDMAEEAFKKAIELNPNSAYVHNNLGLIYLNKGDFQAAATELEKATSFESPTAYMHNNLGIAYERLNQFNKAQEAYQKALDVNKDYQKATINLKRVKSILEQQ